MAATARHAVSEVFPILATHDLDRSLGFYRDLLGGVITFTYPGPDGAVVYAGLDLGSNHLGIGHEPQVVEATRPRAISLWVYTDDCDALVERLREAGTTIVEEPTDQPWGERVARVLDPDGNEVLIGQKAGE